MLNVRYLFFQVISTQIFKLFKPRCLVEENIALGSLKTKMKKNQKHHGLGVLVVCFVFLAIEKPLRNE